MNNGLLGIQYKYRKSRQDIQKGSEPSVLYQCKPVMGDTLGLGKREGKRCRWRDV